MATIASAPTPRLRRNIRNLSQTEADNLIRAFIGIMKLDPEDENSFFKIGGYHGEPFVETGPKYEWGGFCFHGQVVFPTWHRAYCLRIEDALRSIEGCDQVTLPYWDELKDSDSRTPVPEILTNPTYKFANGEIVDNPLYSYTLQKTVVDAPKKHDLHTKAAGYKTVRFPLSGLVGTKDQEAFTKDWNSKFPAPTKHLNLNISNWFKGEIDLRTFTNVRNTDTYSVVARIIKCLDAPNWTAFSNKTSARQWARYNHQDPDGHWVVSIEEPHNAIHLGLGGFFQDDPKKKDPKKKDPEGKHGKEEEDDQEGYNANPEMYQHANGDMGANETAAFDPIFFIHHCFIDYLMWAWQKRHGLTEAGSLVIDYDWTDNKDEDPEKAGPQGTYMKLGNAAVPPDTWLRMDTPLAPFKKPGSDAYWTSDELTNISYLTDDLAYEYEKGSFEELNLTPETVVNTEGGFASELTPALPVELVALKETASVKVSDYNGSFVIRTYAHGPNGEKIAIGCDPVLSRYNTGTCANCQAGSNGYATSVVPVQRGLAEALAGKDNKSFTFSVEIQRADGRQEPLVSDTPSEAFGAPDNVISWD